jgi:hypothetical protein
LCFFEEHELAAIEVIGSAYTELGRRLLASNEIHWVEEEGQHGEGYEHTLPPPTRQAIEELSALIRSRYPTVTFRASPDMDEPDITILWTTVDVDDSNHILDLVSERQLQWQLKEDVYVCVVPIRPPREWEA